MQRGDVGGDDVCDEMDGGDDGGAFGVTSSQASTAAPWTAAPQNTQQLQQEQDDGSSLAQSSSLHTTSSSIRTRAGHHDIVSWTDPDVDYALMDMYRQRQMWVFDPDCRGGGMPLINSIS